MSEDSSFKSLHEQSEFGRKGLQMIQRARDLLTAEVNSIPNSLLFAEKQLKLLEVMQTFLNRLDAVLVGVRDEEDLCFKQGIHWTQKHRGLKH